ncbi:acyl-CoA carboxylase subunit epsilon [Ruicaihuangia caeni]|uniref:Acyl-CoA carboxylase subunit epsilon n=1 Tax=Ruicaihuangia caeni TaxID=3042517 RepID=A0AAW6TAT6_9MICO|nr:acyl-CoA carboxylase subunit epsilon [Klugiella sp. YN-L-19]MDI2099083.1 acyl-CoA carboxylase subunit epsilon [Klugiella sp. YN-L-19]
MSGRAEASSETPGTNAFRVVAGAPTDEELAALVAVLTRVAMGRDASPLVATDAAQEKKRAQRGATRKISGWKRVRPTR